MKKSQTTEPLTIANPSVDITPLIMPISYAVSRAIVLAAIAAFLSQLFRLGKD